MQQTTELNILTTCGHLVPAEKHDWYTEMQAELSKILAPTITQGDIQDTHTHVQPLAIQLWSNSK